MTQENVIPLVEIDSLSREIECLMCLNTANDARMCIHCSAIVCAKCIESWINRSQSCPKCSHPVQQKDFVKCRLANKLIDFIEIANFNNCLIHSKETPRVFCNTCQTHVCSQCILTNGEHINHDYENPDEDCKQISTLNSKLLNFIRKRNKENQDNLKTSELAIQMLLNDHSQNIEHVNKDQQQTELLINETQRLFDEYQQKKQVYNDVIKDDELIINDIERRLKESKHLSDQEEILQILQRHIHSKVDLEENDQ